MKKMIQAELVSIAHRILKLKNNAEIYQLHTESQKLYESLSILKFYYESYESDTQDIPEESIFQQLEAKMKSVSSATVLQKVNLEPESIKPITTPVVEPEEQPIQELKIQKTVLENPVEIDEQPLPPPPINKNTSKSVAASFEELLGQEYKDPVFVKPNEYKATDVNKLGISIGLNDKIAFVSNLFNGNNEDYNRVISQLNTLTSFFEAYDFIADIVKPDYNNWEGKEEYEARFLDVLQKHFS